MASKNITVHENKFSTEFTLMENFLNDLKLTIHFLVLGDLNSMSLEGVASHLHQEESFPTDLAVRLAGICEVVTDLAGARVVHSVLERG